MKSQGTISGSVVALVLSATLLLASSALFCVTKHSEIVPCLEIDTSISPCESREVAYLQMLNPRIEGAMFDYDVPDAEELLEKGVHAPGPFDIAAVTARFQSG